MTELVECDNTTCTTCFDKAADEYVTCSLCKQPAYCSDECRLMNWRVHATEGCNVHKTESIKAGFAVPYYYEDMLTAEELQSVPISDPIFQQHQVMYYNPNRTISQYIVPSLVEKNAESKDDEAPIARGKEPKALSATNYTLGIAVAGRTVYVEGLIPTDMIYKENEKNPTAQALSGGGATFKDRAKNVFRGGMRRALHHAETSYIFWPPNHRLRQQLVEVDLAGDIAITLYTKNAKAEQKEVSSVFAGYKLPVPGKNDASAAARKVQQMFRKQIELKFRNSDLSTKNLYVRRYSDFEGNGVVLTFEITPGSYKAKLVDIEYIVDAERFKSGDVLVESDIQTTKFACNVRDMEDVAGLIMELDTFLASSVSLDAAQKKDLENKAAIIKEYAHKMDEERGAAPAVIPPEVDAAVAGALGALYEPIGMSQSQWDKKAMGTFDNFKADVDRIVARVKELRAASAQDDPSRAKGKLKRGLRTVFQKKPLLADLDRILKAIDKRTGSFGEDGASQETKDKWNALREQVVQAKRSGVV